MLLTADRIHDGYRFLDPAAVLETGADGSIVAIHEASPDGDVQRYQGVLCPGFVNVHCHLELSHLKGILPKHTGLIPFLQKIPFIRGEFSEEQKKAARREAYEELYRNGTAAVGDIANVEDSMDLRLLGKLHMHSFVEAIGFTETHAGNRFGEAVKTYEAFAGQHMQGVMLRQSIVPHAPYSVSPSLFRLIDAHEINSIISIHNQEAEAEDAYYRTKTGPVRELLQGFGIDDSFFEPSGKSSLQTYLEYFSASHPIIFVHNTRTKKEDVDFAQSSMENTYWCLCPNANLYIEGSLPDVDMLMKRNAAICIGTDSLASNHQLSVLSELATINEHFPDAGWERLLKWATHNGAKALGMDEQIGSFEKGKRPGVISLTGLEDGQGTPSVRRIF